MKKNNLIHLLMLPVTLTISCNRSEPPHQPLKTDKSWIHVPPDSYYYPYKDSTCPYTIKEGNERILLIDSVKTNFYTALFPLHYKLIAYGHLIDLATGKSGQMEMTETSWWYEEAFEGFPYNE